VVHRYDYTPGNAPGSNRDDIEYVAYASASYSFSANFSAALSYSFDGGSNLLGRVENSSTLEFERHLIHLLARFAFRPAGAVLRERRFFQRQRRGSTGARSSKGMSGTVLELQLIHDVNIMPTLVQLPSRGPLGPLQQFRVSVRTAQQAERGSKFTWAFETLFKF